jgi:Ca2+/Na+ antiporter
MLASFFASTAFLIALLVIWGIILVINHISYEEDYEWAIGPTIALGIILFFIPSGKDLWYFFLANLKLGIIAIVLYFVIGFFWSLFKWYRFLIKDRDKQIKTIEEEAKLYSRKPDKIRVPKFSDNKALISNWITFFPVSMLAQALRLVFKDIATYIAQIYNKSYTKIVKYVYKDYI